MIHSLFFLCSPIDTKTLRYDSLSCSPRRVWRNQVSTSAMKCHTPRPTQRLAMACHINLAETGRSVVLAAVSGKTRRATCASPTTRQRSPSWKGTMSACRQWHTKCDGRHASESEASTQSNTHTHSQKKNIRNEKTWESLRNLCQGHDDEQKTAIFQKALLVGNEVWMGLSKRKFQRCVCFCEFNTKT